MKAVRTMTPEEEQDWAREMAAPEIPYRQHTAAMLRAGRTYREVAALMGVEVGTVAVMLSIHSVDRCRFCKTPEEAT